MMQPFGVSIESGKQEWSDSSLIDIQGNFRNDNSSNRVKVNDQMKLITCVF
jgi:hypothetical protein